jgi:DNA-binding FadR family transcriptional regulator
VDESTFTPVRPRSAFDETLRRLENAIKLGLLKPGSRLPAERELCTQLGISRSTLRQALIALTASGHLHATRGRGGGTFVTDRPPSVPSPSAEQIAASRDVCDERLAIELGVVALAANRATPQSIEPLKQLAGAVESCADPVRFCQLDRQFHIAIAKLTNSSRLVIASTGVQASIFDLLSTVVPTEEQRRLANAGHQAIVAALTESDEQAAIAAMCTHLGHTSTLFDSEIGPQDSAITASAAT